MDKIPVFRTLGRVYGFAFGRYLTVLGIIWLPLSLLTAASYFLLQPFTAEMASSGQHMPMMLDPRFVRMNFLVQLIALVVSTTVSVGIAKEILGLRTGPRFVYFRFGGAEFRALIGYFALILLVIVLVIGTLLGAVFVGAIGGAAISQANPANAQLINALLAVALSLFVILALIYIVARLSFLFLPATVAENRIGIARSWELTRGNFWRIFWIGFFIFVPLGIVVACVAVAILGAGYFEFAMQHAKDPQAIQDYVMRRVAPLTNNPVVIGVTMLVYPIFYGLAFSPPAFAYRALVPAPAPPAMPEVHPVEPVPRETKESDLPPVLEEVLEKLSDHGEDEKH